MGLLTPSPTINYNFVAGVYGAFALLCIILYVCQRFTDAVDGFYIVFVPFLPCFLWSLLVRQRWVAANKETAALEADAAPSSPSKAQDTKKDK